jgi:hypothetical protein
MGPRKVRTSIRDDVVVVMLQDTLLKVVRSLIREGRDRQVVEMRLTFQQSMRDDCAQRSQASSGDRVHERQQRRAGLLGPGGRARAGGRGERLTAAWRSGAMESATPR